MSLREVKLLGLFYLSHFFSTALNATEAIWVVYMMSKGFTFTQIGLNFSVFALSRLLFEVPTGAIADLYGRKLSVVLGWILTGALFFMLPFVDTFSLWIIVVFLSAIPYTMISGASDAWAVDHLKKNRALDLSAHYFAHTETIRNLSFAIAGGIGTALIWAFSMDAIFYAVSLGFVLAGLSLMFQKENYMPIRKTSFSLKDSLKHSFSGFKTAFITRNIRYLTLSSMFLSLSAISWVAWEPLFLQNSIAITYFPLILTAAFLFSSLASFISKHLVSRFKDEKHYLIATTLLMSISHIAVFFIAGPLAAVSLFVLKNGFFAFRFPIKQDLLHQAIPSKLRATIGSIDSMCDAISVAIASLFGGMFMDFAGVNLTILVTGLLMLPSAVFSALITMRKK